MGGLLFAPFSLESRWGFKLGGSLQDKYNTSFFTIAFKDGTPKKAFFTACVVGTVLTTINHGDTILLGEFPPLLKVLLTYCVPFCVTTWGSYLGKKAKIEQQQKIEVLTGNSD